MGLVIMVKSKKDKIKNNKVLMVIFTIIIGLAVGLFIIAVLGSKKDVTYTYMNDLILKDEDNVLKNSNLEVHSSPLVFAEYDNDPNKFYIVQDENYLYIVYLTEEIYDEIMDKDLEKEPFIIEGYTEIISDDIKTLAIDSYNELMEEEIITEDNFKSYFGSIYLNTTDVYRHTDIFYYISLVLGIIGVIGLLMSLKDYKYLNKNVRKKVTNKR